LEVGYDRTERVTIATGIGAVLTAGLGLAGVKLIGPVALFVAPMFGNVGAIWFLLPRLRGGGLRPQLNGEKARALARAGYPLALALSVYWAYRAVGPWSVGLALGATSLGFYALASAPITLVIGALTVGVRIFMPRFWQQMVHVPRKRWISDGDRTTSLFVVVAVSLAMIGQAAYPWFIHTFLPRYEPSVPVFLILSLEIPLYLAGQAPGLVLESVVVNRQKLNLGIWMAALLANALVNGVLLSLHFGIGAIAWTDVGVQAGVVVALFSAARPYQATYATRLGDLAPGIIAFLTFLAVSAILLAQSASGSGSTQTSEGVAVRLVAALAGTALVVGASLAAGRRQRRLD
jgi:O-antigen/teichoic acid export membrane protein